MNGKRKGANENPPHGRHVNRKATEWNKSRVQENWRVASDPKTNARVSARMLAWLTAFEGDVEEAAREAGRRLAHKGQVCHQREALQPEVGDEGLQQQVHLSRGTVARGEGREGARDHVPRVQTRKPPLRFHNQRLLDAKSTAHLTLAVGSSMASLIGTGTRAASFSSSSFSSSRTWMNWNSADRLNSRNSSMSLMVGFRYSLYLRKVRTTTNQSPERGASNRIDEPRPRSRSP